MPADYSHRVVKSFEESGLFFIIRRCRFGDGFLIIAKKEPFVTDGEISEPGDVWFEFALNPEAAIRNLKSEILH